MAICIITKLRCYCHIVNLHQVIISQILHVPMLYVNLYLSSKLILNVNIPSAFHCLLYSWLLKTTMDKIVIMCAPPLPVRCMSCYPSSTGHYCYYYSALQLSSCFSLQRFLKYISFAASFEGWSWKLLFTFGKIFFSEPYLSMPKL